MDDDRNPLALPGYPEIIRKIRARTPARIFVKQGSSYTTQMALELRIAHARAVDAVRTEFDLLKNLPADLVAQSKLFQVSSQAESKSQFLLRPDLGRKLSDSAKVAIAERCRRAPEFQIVIGDGLSEAALSAQVPALLPLLQERANASGWSMGQSFAVRYCRVGIMNDIGDLLEPRVILLLIGERPGLATVASLSAYMAYCPHSGQTDADRNLVSNIHARGVGIEDAVDRILSLARRMMALKESGTTLKGDRAPRLGA
jgi:ethanolamine ammonia-lyase small subunit